MTKRKSFSDRFLAAAVAACLCVGGLPGTLVRAEESDEAAMGRYLESEMSVPEDMEIQDLVSLPDGKLRIAGSRAEEPLSLWDSSDGGATWEQTAALPDEYKDEYFVELALDSNGGGAGIIMKNTNSASEDAAADGESAEEFSEDAAADGESAEEFSEDAAADGESAEEFGEDAAADDESAEEFSEAAADGESAEEFSEYTAADDGEVSEAALWDGLEFYYVNFDAEGNASSTKLSDAYSFYVQLSRDGSLLSMSYGGEVAVRSRETGEITNIITTDVNMMGHCGQEILGITDSEVRRYDIATGEPLARDEALEEALFAGGDTYYIMSSATRPIVFAEDEERMYYATEKGIFSHVMDGSVVEQVVDGKLNSLSDPSVGLISLAVQDQVFYALYMNARGKYGIMKYEYSDEVASTPSRELTIYSLKESATVKQMAVLFQKEYPDTYVNYEYGMTGEDGITVSDALRTLNTDILAGNGPDILVLDNMSVQTYAGKGVLADLSGILKETEDSDGLFENIAYAYQEGDTVPAVPAMFCIPMMAGSMEYISQAIDLASVAELANTADVLSANDMAIVADLYYPLCSGAWKKEDDTIDQEKLTEYVSGIRQIYQNYKASASQKNLENLEIWEEEMAVSYSWIPGYFDGDIAMGSMTMLSGANKVLLGSLTSMDDYAELASVNHKFENYGFGLQSGLQSNVFRPYCVLGMLNTAKESERAADFIKFALSEAVQVQKYSTGFPVNRKAFEEILTEKEWGEDTYMSFSSSLSDGSEEFTLNVYWPTEEEGDSLRAMVEQLSVCADEDSVQSEVVLEQTRSCMKGEISVEDAVNAIIQKVNLYLAE